MVVWEYFNLHEYQGWSSPLPHLFRGYKNLSQYVTEMMRKVLRKFILKAFHLLSHTASPPFGPIVLIFWKRCLNPHIQRTMVYTSFWINFNFTLEVSYCKDMSSWSRLHDSWEWACMAHQTEYCSNYPGIGLLIHITWKITGNQHINFFLINNIKPYFYIKLS